MYYSVSFTHTMGHLRRSPSHLVSHLLSLFSEPMSPSIKILSIADLVLYCFPDTDPYSECFSPALMAELTRRVLLKQRGGFILLSWLTRSHLFLVGTGDYLTIATGTYITMNSGEPTISALNKISPNVVVSQLNVCICERRGMVFGCTRPWSLVIGTKTST